MRKFILILLIVFPTIGNAQVAQEWTARYGGENPPSASWVKAMVVDNFGNVFVTGYSYGGSTHNNFVTIKYSSTGQELWRAVYDGPAHSRDEASCIAMDSKGNIYIVGSCSTNSETDLALIKYNSNGILQWVKFYGENNGFKEITHKESILIDSNNDIYISLRSEVPLNNNEGTGFTTLKYNSNGDLIWSRIYMQHSFDSPFVISFDNEENIIVGGYGYSSSFDYALIKYTPSGDSLWTARYNSSNNATELMRDLYVDKYNNVYVTGGGAENDSAFFYDMLTVKYDSAGNEIWVSRYEGPGKQRDFAYSIVVDDSQNVYTSGVSYVSGSNWQYSTIKIGNNGELKWALHLDDNNGYPLSGFDMEIDKDGFIYVTGDGKYDSSYIDYLTYKLDPDGNILWKAVYDGFGEYDAPVDLCIDDKGFVYLTGLSMQQSRPTYLTIKYSQTVGINTTSSEIPNRFSLHQNYPNPFNPSTRIKFEIPKASLVRLAVYDILGRQVAELVNQNMNAGTYEYEWSGVELSSGIYFYKLEAGEYQETKRMALAK